MAPTVGVATKAEPAGLAENAWRVAAPLLGLTLLEAATVAHGAREAWRAAGIHLRRAQGWLVLVPYVLRLWWNGQRCPRCNKRLPFLKGGLCDRCAAAALPALRLKVAQLQAEVDGLELALSEALRRAALAHAGPGGHGLPHRRHGGGAFGRGRGPRDWAGC